MANLTISAVCNQTCPYCFTLDHVADSTMLQPFLQLGDWAARLDFLDRSGIDQVRLLGGEPTLHPQFLVLVEQVRQRNKNLVVFTNGLMPDQVLTRLAELAETEFLALVNVNEPGDSDKGVFEKQRRTLRQLGRKAQLGYNIYRSNFQPDFLLPLIAETGIKPAVRLGLAQPCLSGDNCYIRSSQYSAIGEKIMRFAIRAAAAGVRIELDCGFVRCMFSDDAIAQLIEMHADVAWRCSPILDVGLQGQVIHCYPLSRLACLPLTADIDAATLRSSFESITRPYRQTGVFRECHACVYKVSGECAGGCLAVTLRRFRHTPFRLNCASPEVNRCQPG